MTLENRQPTPQTGPLSAHRIPSGGGGVVGVWYRDGRVLMTRRAAGISYPGLWCFPGGGIEAGEDEIAALKREWREELGTSVEPLRKIGSFETSNAAGRFPLHWYFVASTEEAFQPNPQEVAEVRWMPLEQLPDLPDLIGSNRAVLATLGPDLRRACEQVYKGPARAGTPNAVGRPTWLDDLRRDLDDLRARSVYRRLRTVDSAIGRTLRLDGRGDVLNFASNDYLGLAADPRLAQAAADALGRFGWGAGGSRLVCGHTSLHAELERALAAFKGTEAALLLPTGYMANLAAIRALAGEGDVILLDKLDHASIIDAAGSCGAEVRVFPHRNYDKLERLLQRYASSRRRLIVTDTVFSMDGDLADLPRLAALKSAAVGEDGDNPREPEDDSADFPGGQPFRRKEEPCEERHGEGIDSEENCGKSG